MNLMYEKQVFIRQNMKQKQILNALIRKCVDSDSAFYITIKQNREIMEEQIREQQTK